MIFDNLQAKLNGSTAAILWIVGNLNQMCFPAGQVPLADKPWVAVARE